MTTMIDDICYKLILKTKGKKDSIVFLDIPF